MTIAAESLIAESPHRRRQSRVERQARVGILRNPNEPPRPPPRKASLTGRWLSLRSSRRPPTQEVVDAAFAVSQTPDSSRDTAALPAAALRHDDQGRLAGIDVAGLMASVEGLGTSRPIRTPYGAEIRPDVAPPPAPRPRPRIEAEEPSETADPPPPPPAPPAMRGPEAAIRLPRRTRSALWPVVGGIALAFVALILVPALLTL